MSCNYYAWKQGQAWFRKRRKADLECRQIIVITGCDRGFGRMLAENLTKSSDFIVVALLRTEEAVAELQELFDPNSHHLALQCDVTNENQIAQMARAVDQLLEQHKGVLYAIVNNAGIADPGDFLFDPTLTTYKNVMDVNFFGMLRVTQALLPTMLRTSKTIPQGARIINMSSVCGAVASPSNGAYNASKFAIEAWSDSLRLELEPFNIAVSKIRPGQIKTQIQSDWQNNYMKNLDAAPANIQELYGGHNFRKYVLQIFETITSSQTMGDPAIVINTLKDVLTLPKDKLKPYYWVGDDANTLWRALSLLPVAVSDTVKRNFFHFRPIEPPAPPAIDTVSHVTIRVRNLDKSLAFYQAVGLVIEGDRVNGQQFLRLKQATHTHETTPTRVLLMEDPNMPARGASSDAGMTRLCIYTNHIQKDEQRMTSLGWKAIAPMAVDTIGNIVAYKDPDGFVVYFIQMKSFIGWMVRAFCWYKGIQAPFLFHLTLNVTNAQNAMRVFSHLGFQTMSDQTKTQVRNELLSAFQIDPKSTVIEHIRICHLPRDGFCATLMQWVHPSSECRGSQSSNQMAIAVSNVHAWLERAKEAGMVVTGSPEYRRFPIYGKVLVGRAYVEENENCPIEFICFNNRGIDENN